MSCKKWAPTPAYNEYQCIKTEGHEGTCFFVKKPKPGFWSRLGTAAAELVANLLYQGPR